MALDSSNSPPTASHVSLSLIGHGARRDNTTILVPKPTPWSWGAGIDLLASTRTSMPVEDENHPRPLPDHLGMRTDIAPQFNIPTVKDTGPFLCLHKSTQGCESLGRISLEGLQEEGPRMELGLKLMGFSAGTLSRDGNSAITSVESDAGTFVTRNQNPGTGANASLVHGQMGLLFGRNEVASGGEKPPSAPIGSFSGDDLGMQLQLGVSGGSTVTMESNMVSSMQPDVEPNRAHQETVRDNAVDGRVILPDEGSTSARSVKTGGYMPSLLMGLRFDNVPVFTRQDDGNLRLRLASRKDSPIGTIEDLGLGLVSPKNKDLGSDLFLNFRATTSGTTAISTASGGLLDQGPRMCKFKGCGKGARGASGLCITHGGGRRCEKQGCNKGAEGRTVYCKAHGGGRRCQSLGCTRSAEGRTDYCIGHGGGRRCSHDGCTKAARGRSGLCIRHGGGKRCNKEGCTKSAEGHSGFCISHGGGRRCQYPGCIKGAQGSTMLCKAHGGGKRCMIQGCNKGAEGSTPLCKGHGGGKRCMFDGGGICTKSVHGGTSFCVAHGGGKRCAVEGCTKSARGRTQFCVRHGGGKRCQFVNCTKSAQGSTDFCKAHGGGKRCSWGQEGSPYYEFFCDKAGDAFKGPCDRFARGKIGLCAAHSALVQDRRVHGAGTIGKALPAGIGPGLFRGLVPSCLDKGPSMPASSDISKQFTHARDHSGDQNSECGVSDTKACPSGGSSEVDQVGTTSESIHGRGLSVSSQGGSGFVPTMTLTELNSSSLQEENQCQNRLNSGVSVRCCTNSCLWPGLLDAVQNANSHLINVQAGKFFVPNHLHLHTTSRKVATESGGVLYRPFIPPQVLVPLSMQKGECFASSRSEQKATANDRDDCNKTPPSSSLTEGRVHSGSLMPLLSEKDS